MTQVNGFDFSKYDVGGTGATAGDGKLTGAEAEKARADGWTVWDGFNKDDKAEYVEQKEAKTPIEKAGQNLFMELKAKAAKKNQSKEKQTKIPKIMPYIIDNDSESVKEKLDKIRKSFLPICREVDEVPELEPPICREGDETPGLEPPIDLYGGGKPEIKWM